MLSVLLTVAVLATVAYSWIRFRVDRFRRDVQRSYDDRPRGSLPPGA